MTDYFSPRVLFPYLRKLHFTLFRTSKSHVFSYCGYDSFVNQVVSKMSTVHLLFLIESPGGCKPRRASLAVEVPICWGEDAFLDQ